MSGAFPRRLPCFQDLSSLVPLLRPLLALNFPCSDNPYPYRGKATINVGSGILTNLGCYQSVYVRALDVEPTVLFTSIFASSSIVISPPPSSFTSIYSIPSDTTTPVSTSSPSTSHVGAIAGGVVGGLAGLGLVIAGAIFWLHRRKQREMRVTPPEVSQVM